MSAKCFTTPSYLNLAITLAALVMHIAFHCQATDCRHDKLVDWLLEAQLNKEHYIGLDESL